jgi:hypothetical protein
MTTSVGLVCSVNGLPFPNGYLSQQTFGLLLIARVVDACATQCLDEVSP